MNHFLILEIGQKKLQVTTYLVCPNTTKKNTGEPRWKADKSVWDKITLECKDQEAGVTPYEQFQILIK